MKRLGVWVLMGALCISLIRIGITAYSEAPSAEESFLSAWTGFVYRAPWNSQGQLTIIGRDFTGLLSVRGYSQAVVAELEAGCYVKFKEISLRTAEPARNPGTFDYRLYLRSRGVSYLCAAKEEDLVFQDHVPFLYLLRLPGARFRTYARKLLSGYLNESSGELIHAVMTGDTGGISETDKTSFRESGLSHLMAVSGTHVTFILGPFRRMGRREWLAYEGRNALLLLPLFVFWMLADFTPSVTRACISAAGLAVARMVGRPPDGLNFLALSAGIQMLWNPYVLCSAGFLMSYGAAFGIYFVLPVLQRRFAFFREEKSGLIKKLRFVNRNALAAGISVNLILAPLMIYLFGTFSLCGVFLTLYASFPASLLCGGGYLLCILGAIPGIFLLCRPISFFLYGVCQVFLGLARLGEKLPAPIGTVRITGFSLWLLMGYYILLWLCLFGYGSKLLRKGYAILRKKGKYRVLAGGLSVLAVAVSFYGLYQTTILRILFMDVGQGAATLVEAAGSVGMIDTGDGDTPLSEILWAQGVDALDFVVLTHGHSDHTGGLKEVMENFTPDVLYVSGNCEDGLLRACQLAETYGAQIYQVEHGQYAMLGQVRMEFLVSETFFGVTSESGENNASLCVHLSCDYGSVTVCGDLETAGEMELCKMQAFSPSDVLFVPHHGSGSGSSEKMLSNIMPEYAIISVGAGNTYGHPAEDTLNRLEAAGAQIYRTDLCGGIFVTIGRRTLFRKRCVEVWQTL